MGGHGPNPTGPPTMVLNDWYLFDHAGCAEHLVSAKMITSLGSKITIIIIMVKLLFPILQTKTEHMSTSAAAASPDKCSAAAYADTLPH